MAFGDLASNQGVSFTNAQTGGFTLKPGQSSVTSDEQMTKLDATTKYYLDISNIYLSPKPNNQVVAKRDLTSGDYCQSIGVGNGCFNWNVIAGASGAVVQVINCSGVNTSVVLGANGTGNLCACDQVTPTVTSGSATLNQVGSCIGTTTTTTSSTTRPTTTTTTSTTTASPTTTTSTTTVAQTCICYIFTNEGVAGASVFYNICGQSGYTSVAVNAGTSVQRCCRIDNGNYPYTNDINVTIDPCSSVTNCTTNANCVGCS